MRNKKPKLEIDWSKYPQLDTETDSEYTDRFCKIVKEHKDRLKGPKKIPSVDLSLPIYGIVNVEGYPYYLRTNSDPKKIRDYVNKHGLESKPWRNGTGINLDNQEFFTGGVIKKYPPETVEKLKTWNPFPPEGNLISV